MDINILELLSIVLREVNPYVQFWRNAAQRIAENALLTIRLTMLDPTVRDPRRYNRPAADEVAAIIVQSENDDEPLDRDVIIQHQHTGELQRISQHSPCYMSMCYPVIIPHGEEGWHPLIPLADINLADNVNLQVRHRTHINSESEDDSDAQDAPRHGRGGSKRVSLSQYHAFQLHKRDGIFSPLLHAGRLCQEYCVDAWVCAESNRLQWVRTNQAKLRADCYNGLQDAIGTGIEEDAHRLGRQIILPSSIPGTARYMKQLYQDAMAICRHYNRPDFFVTFTCNPKWDEITAEIPAGSNASDHPEIVSRVFSLKLKALIDDLLNKHVLGKTVADVYVIEFQKRGLPHAHILLIMNRDDKIRDVEGIDDTICAEIPDCNIDPILYDIVSHNMMHGPCGSAYPNSPCMKYGKCSKKYPRQFCDETMANEDGYPIYRRRQFIEGEERKVKCKHVWLDNRWVVPYCPLLSKRYNAHINIEICSTVSVFKYLFKYVYKGGDRTTAVLQNEANEIQDYVDARYLSAPEAVWHIFGFKLHHRSPAIQRLQIHLLNEQTVMFNDDTDIVTLLQNDHIRKTTLTEFFTANKQAAEAAVNDGRLNFDCRELLYQEFPTYMVWKQKLRRWNRRKNGIGSTIGRMYFVGPSGGERFYLRMLLTIVKGPTSFEDLHTYDGVVQSLALCLIRDILHHNNSDLDKHDLPLPTHEFVPIDLNINRLIADERNYNVDSLKAIVERDTTCLNADQRAAFDALCRAVTSGEGGVFFWKASVVLAKHS